MCKYFGLCLFKIKLLLGGVAQLEECLCTVPSNSPGVVGAYLNSLRVQGEGSEVQVHPLLASEFELASATGDPGEEENSFFVGCGVSCL